METIKQMKDRWTLLLAAKHADGVNKGRLVTETDPKYAREVFALGVQISEREAAENARPQISPRQLEQLQWLDRLEGARDKDGIVVSQTISEDATRFRKSLHEARTHVLEGRDISGSIASTERDAQAKGWTLGAPAKPAARVLMPSNRDVPSPVEAAGLQPIHTERDSNE